MQSPLGKIGKFLPVMFSCLMIGKSTLVAAPPAGVTVTYAFVPKERLSEAVKGKREALEVEAAWRKEIASKSPAIFGVTSEQYSIVVFVDNVPSSALWGQIGFPIQHPRSMILNVTLAPGYHGTYVIDGGGMFLMNFPPEPKPYEWIEVHSK